ncbi:MULTISPECIES: hypothetical protein [Sphaerimonospora]|uniref:Uncharacterized protein n=2 Tax=Sphaerimonospora TaxID=1792303 RepID=A0A8J3RB91_9ACTN|nr:hypothetical protein [Sphaerimonospora thailandensis]GIH71680.1 hypothetical protein Mth01_39330 [Sphaerimonospora thailandensis]
MKYLTIQEVLCVGDLSGFEARLDELMNSLLDLAEQDTYIEDPDLAATLTIGRVDVQMTVEAEDPAEAMVKALCALRTAIHAIGDATPGWETDRAVMHVAPLEDADRLFADA